METTRNDLDVRSDEIQDIMQRTPAWIVRWGITSVFVLILSGLILSWLIKYPEIINGSVKLTTSSPPVKIVCQSSGNLTHLFVKDGEEVKEGTLLAEIENPLSANAVKYVENYLAQLDRAVREKSASLPLPDTSGIALGELQAIFNELQKDLSAINLRRAYKMDDAEITELEQRIKHQNELLKINSSMIDITSRELDNARKKFESDSVLYRNKVISTQDFLQNQTEFHNKELQFENLEQTKVQNSISLNNLQLQYSQAKFNKELKDKSTSEIVKTFRKSISSYIYGWQQKFRLFAIRQGKVCYLKTLQPNLFLRAGEELFALLEPQGTFIGLAEVPVAGFGKVQIGQTAHILLDNYPDYDYGVLSGVVKNIALIPNANTYRVEIALPDGMLSSQGLYLKFTPEMIGVAEIVTEDKTVMERMFKSIIKLFQRK